MRTEPPDSSKGSTHLIALSKQDLDALEADGIIEILDAFTFVVQRKYLHRPPMARVEEHIEEEERALLPRKPVSISTGLYLGFSFRGAQRLIERWHHLREHGWFQDEPPEYFTAVVQEIVKEGMANADVTEESSVDVWKTFLEDGIGLDSWIVQMMFVPHLEALRRSRPMEYWVTRLVRQRCFDLSQNMINLRERNFPVWEFKRS